MKTKTLLTAVLLALAGSAAQATTITAGLNDLILGFRATGGTGASLNLEVDLGNVSNYYDASGTLAITGLNVADIVSTYGSDWATRTDLFWGVAGTTGSAAGTTFGSHTLPADTMWASKAEATLGIQSTAWTQANVSAQQGPSNAIANLYSGGVGSLNAKTSTTNSTVSAVIDTSLAGSWTLKEGSPAFGFFTRNLFENGTSNALGAVSDLFEVKPTGGASTYLGSFGLGSNGSLFFSSTPGGAAAAVPEPSTYAAIFGVVTLGFVAYRRRQQKRQD